MRFVFFLVLIVHGFIHSIGFIKAFQLAEMNVLKTPISKSVGLLWFVTACLFIIGALLFIFNQMWWWMPSLIAVLLSQTVIILSWQDAKFGTILNILILIFSIVGAGMWQFSMQANKDIQQFLSEVHTKETRRISEASLDTLPIVVQKWLKQTGVVGQEEIKTVFFKQKGRMKLKPDQKDWYHADAEQFVRIAEPGFIWKVDMKMMPFVHVAGRDSFQDGRAKMMMKISSIIPVVDEAGNRKVDESSLQRYLLELPLYPSAALQPYIVWEEIDETTAKATMSYKGTSGSVLFYFNEKAELSKVSAMRYKDSDEKAERIECIGEIKNSKIMEGVKIPERIDISWMLKEGKFTWYTLEIYDYQSNDLTI
ncbi:DUF6920 family protein [Bacillus tuaregi]|uniref:DUF6920 family protein n=1 Tax=Bacillus tuaregi TaxID=1816695 RepID=UPI0008F8E61E|nr:DUF6544 family protein [Bacillus tuaregi]